MRWTTLLLLLLLAGCPEPRPQLPGNRKPHQCPSGTTFKVSWAPEYRDGTAVEASCQRDDYTRHGPSYVYNTGDGALLFKVVYQDGGWVEGTAIYYEHTQGTSPEERAKNCDGRQVRYPAGTATYIIPCSLPQ